jgi:hypothetical protein
MVNESSRTRFLRIPEPAYLGAAALFRFTPMHEHSVVPEAVSVLGRAENQPVPERRRCRLWNMGKALDVGSSYLVGATVPLSEFQRVHTSSLNEWQRLAFEWCMANPSRMLVLTSTKPRLIYHIAKRGEYVELGLPHHCHGGEKYWVSRNGKTRVLINVD